MSGPRGNSGDYTGLMQLVAYGAQDIFITGNPQITFFKVVYRRHTNFAIEAIEQTLNGSTALGGKATATISRNGDLITNVWIEVAMTKTAGTLTTFFPAEALLKTIELEIGGQRIDKHYDTWMRVYNELFRNLDEKAAYERLTGFGDDSKRIVEALTKRRFFVPLIFFFNRNPGLALPLIALQYHEVKITLELASSVDGITSLDELKMFVDYVYLDTDERRRFAQVSHEYLIEQLQFVGDENTPVDASTAKTYNLRLNFNHPVKYLVWVVKSSKHGQFTAFDAATGQTSNDVANTRVYYDSLAPIDTVKLQLNGHDRFSERKGRYFSEVQTAQHCGVLPSSGIYMYSFALKPAEHQPSGTCNFSRIDNATLQLKMKTASQLGNVSSNVTTESATASSATNLTTTKVFAVNYNILRIMSGMGGLAYSN